MIIFHEGLPRSGKTYECVVRHICKALREGRRVVAYIEGLNHDKLAEVCEIAPERCRELLKVIQRDEVLRIADWAEDNALIVVDEVQNFWPMDVREKLPPKVMQLAAEHGRRGMDVVVMGQCFADVHSGWRRRVSMRVEFMKREALGKPDEYTWRMYKATAPEKFLQVSTGKGVYEQKYFDTYKSYDVEAPANSAYEDERAIIWNNKTLRRGGVVVGVLLVVAIGVIYRFFSSGAELVPETKKPELPAVRMDVQPGARVVESVPVSPVPEIVRPPEKPQDFIAVLARDSRPRLAAVLYAQDRQTGIIEFYREGDRVHERMTFEAVEAFGWRIERMPYGVLMVKDAEEIPVTQWPLRDQPYRVSEARIEQVRELGAFNR